MTIDAMGCQKKIASQVLQKGADCLQSVTLCVNVVVTEWYNHEHRHSALRYVTPSQRHNGEAKGILAQRREVFEAAKQRHPERW